MICKTILLLAFLLLTKQDNAFFSYHNYYSSFSMYKVSCSDGANGVASRWGY